MYKASDHCGIHVGTKLNWQTGECPDCGKKPKVGKLQAVRDSLIARADTAMVRAMVELDAAVMMTPTGNRRNRLCDIRNDLQALQEEIQDGKI